MDEMKPAADQLSPVKQALLKVRDMRARLDAIEYRRREPIAIVGVGLRFPGGCRDLDGFWQLLVNGVDAIREVPRERWDIDAYYDPDPDAPGKMYTRHGGFLDRIDEFDPAFFGISPREAQSMDPQQRLLLEVGWEALENAGQAPDRLSESASGIFLAINNSDYFRYLFASPQSIDAYTTTGSAASVAAARLAYLLNLKGPALAVDTACSSSLVATHLAVRSLRSGECDLALAGGVNLMLLPEITINFCKSRMLAADGRCKSFAAAADGYVRGEGCAMVVLKRLSDARSNGDPILALIRGSAVNQDGRSGGITAPNGPAQEAVIRRALQDAGIDAAAVGYIEAHGTATPLGDPIEARALGAVFGRARDPGRRLAIGSIKTNIGHLEAAAGLAGLIKTALVLQKGVVPPSLHLKQVNPLIELDMLGLTIPTAAVAWPAGAGTRIAGVSSFGLSGTNAHLLLEQALEPERPAGVLDQADGLQVLTLSARSEAALLESAASYATCLAACEAPFADICHTANSGRTHFSHRLAVLARSAGEAAGHLAAWRKSPPGRQVLHGLVDEPGAPKIVFLFTGQGAQYPGMGRGLFETQPVFRDALQECDRLLRPHLDVPLLELLYDEPHPHGRLDQTRYTQPALFALEYALTRLWRSWGIKPAAVMGHSLGEYAAACAAGVFSLADGLRLVARRAELIDALPETGSMAVVFADHAAVGGLIAAFEGVCLAALNGPANTVIAGSTAAVHAAVADLAGRGIAAKPLNVSHAFHSALMDPMLDDLARAAATIAFSDPGVTFISNLSGRPAGGAEIGRPEYWRRHLREPVRFAESIAGLIGQGCRLFVEIGPQPVLLGMAKSLVAEEDAAWLPSLRRAGDDHAQMLESLAALHVRGAAVDWARFGGGAARRRVHLPTYPFQRARYWADMPAQSPHPAPPEPAAAWDFVVGSARRQAAQAPLDLQVEGYAEKWRRLETLTRAVIEHVLAKMGLFTQAGESHSIESIMAGRSMLPAYRKLLQRWLTRLSRAGALRQAGERFSAVRPLDDAGLSERLAQCAEAFRDQPLFFDYIQRCGRLAADILAGRQDPLETLFPGGASDLAEWLYGEWPVSRYISAIAAAAAAAAAHAGGAAGMARFIEIGAGTGGTTGAVLSALPPGRVEYWFTDISEFFFHRAREKFAAHPLLRFGLLDVEKDPSPQGFAQSTFDAVIATNVLHATTRLEAAVDHARALLAPGGVLILSEVTEDFAWHDITTGLIEGWQRFEDERRRHSPLLDARQWQDILRSRGFDAAACFPGEGTPTAILGQHVILARAPLGKQARTAAGAAAIRPAGRAAGADGEVRANPPAGPAVAELMRNLQAAPPRERRERLVELVRAQLAAVLRLDPQHLPGRKARLMDLGLDSLMAVELRNRLSRALGPERKLPATLVFDYPTAEAIAAFLEREFLTVGQPALQERTAADRAADRIARLSDAEVEQMLMERLKQKQEMRE